MHDNNKDNGDDDDYDILYTYVYSYFKGNSIKQKQRDFNYVNPRKPIRQLVANTYTVHTFTFGIVVEAAIFVSITGVVAVA